VSTTVGFLMRAGSGSRRQLLVLGVAALIAAIVVGTAAFVGGSQEAVEPRWSAPASESGGGPTESGQSYKPSFTDLVGVWALNCVNVSYRMVVSTSGILTLTTDTKDGRPDPHHVVVMRVAVSGIRIKAHVETTNDPEFPVGLEVLVRGPQDGTERHVWLELASPGEHGPLTPPVPPDGKQTYTC
jgi:hypothetical protein